MDYVLIGTSILFVLIGLIVTEKNAKYLLSGYNTMNEENRKKFDIKSYIPYFRKFHIFLGFSFLIFGLLLHYYVNPNYSGVFLGVYPLFAYLYFILAGKKYHKNLNYKWNKVGTVILIVTLISVVGLFYIGFKENRLLLNDREIEIQGIYGEHISSSNIESIELSNHLPNITRRTNGFALGTIKKGYFKTSNGEKVKLILNSDQKPYILLTKSNGEKIYYSAKEKKNKNIMDMLKNFAQHDE